MYSLILTVWYKTWDFVSLDTIVTPIVGLVSIIGGLFFLKEWHKKELECKVTNLKERSKTKLKIQQLAMNKFTLFTFLGILGIAFSVNIIEFACSIGIPQAFTKILELNSLSLPQWLLMIGIYIFFYMLDDLIVFREEEKKWFIVVNGATTQKDAAHFQSHLTSRAVFKDVSLRTGKIDVQGPLSRDVLRSFIAGVWPWQEDCS